MNTYRVTLQSGDRTSGEEWKAGDQRESVIVKADSMFVDDCGNLTFQRVTKWRAFNLRVMSAECWFDCERIEGEPDDEEE